MRGAGPLVIALLALAPAASALRLDPVADVAQGVARASTPMLVNGAMSPAARAAAAAAVAPMRAQLRNTTDCVSSLLFYEFALALLPLRDARDVFESLKLDLDCGVAPPPTTVAHSGANPSRAAQRLAAFSAQRLAAECGGAPVFVDAGAAGSDDAAAGGTLAQPLKTIHAAVARVRARRAAAAAADARSCIVLRAGTHYLGSTVRLTAADSGLAFTAFHDDAEPAGISGGVPLLGLGAWQPYNVTPDGASNVWVASVPPALLAQVAHMPSLNTLSPLTRLTNAQYPNYDIGEGKGDDNPFARARTRAHKRTLTLSRVPCISNPWPERDGAQ
jgi:N-acetylmuramoyl-L-alanine amidase